MAKTQKYGIGFPFQCESSERSLMDLNRAEESDIKSQIMHILFTPVGQRLRRPLFGTKLIQFIFSPSDTQTWDEILDEIKTSVRNGIPNCEIEGINAEKDEENGVKIHIQYSVTKNGTTTTYSLETTL